MKPKYCNNMELLMTDTDSFVYKIKTDDFYKEMYDMKEYFDLSEYDKSYQYFDDSNKKVLGMFKDETPKSTINTFIGVRSKLDFFDFGGSFTFYRFCGIGGYPFFTFFVDFF